MIVKEINLHKSRIVLGEDCIGETLASLNLEDYSSLFIISQENIWNFHGHRVMAAFESWETKPQLRLLDDGERIKNLSVFGDLLSWLADCGADRKSAILVLGGGVVGDLSGYVAASYMRGMEWIYMPTTLLSQQDASVGGKTAVNLPQGKNLVGAFWEPRAVIIDSATLETLPQREVHAGYMEFIKHGILHSEELYQDIAALSPDADLAQHTELLARGLQVKVDVVQQDPLEKGQRRLLNLGHTLGHAIESHTGYTTFLHGEAVGLGMIYAGYLAQELGGAYDYTALNKAVLSRLPKFDPLAWDKEKLLQLTQLDKKGVKGVVSWIIPYGPGRVEIVKGVAQEALEKALDRFIEAVR